MYGSKGWGSLYPGARAGERQLEDEPGTSTTLKREGGSYSPAGMGVSLGGAGCRLPSVECGLTDTDISSVAYKTPCNNYREGMILYVFVGVCNGA